MERSHYPEKRKHLSLACIVFLLAVLRQCEAIEVNSFNNTVSCFENEYEHNGFCCNKCHAGFKLTQKCLGQNLRSTCEKCSDGTFQDIMNHFPNCFLCRKPCDPADKEIEKDPCTHTHDRKCGCVDGYYENRIDQYTMSCKSCQKCGKGEIETSQCEGQKNRVCQCKHNHYRVVKGICAPCTNCSSECNDFCPSVKPLGPSPRPPGPPIENTFIFAWAGLCVVICFLGLCTGLKHWKKRKQTLYCKSPEQCDPENQVGKIETHTCLQNTEDESHLLAVQKDPVLPDCIPREIKTHEFIYFVLDIVPVNRFKELARRLNVSEQDIERAERDNRAFADAQYQMLMVWVDSGTAGGKNVLSLLLLQECVNRLKEMNLTACAESIEEKYD